MKLRVLSDDDYVYLNQLSRGDITVTATPPAMPTIREIVTSVGGYWPNDGHGNWIVPYPHALALFDKLYQLSQQQTHDSRSPGGDQTSAPHIA